MILGIICTVVLGSLALYQTLQCRAYQRVIAGQSDAISHASDALVREMARRHALARGLMRVHGALQRGDVSAVLAEINAMTTLLRAGNQ